MKKRTLLLITALILAFGFPTPGSADKPMTNGKHDAGGDRDGAHILDAQVEGGRLSYYLIDARERIKRAGRSDHGLMNMTHHLMVYLKDRHGKTIPKAKAGYLVKGPDGGKQKGRLLNLDDQGKRAKS